ncbi:NUDIX domain-containing protein [Pedobacter sp. MC2016-14]|uniref:NUDIX hydrolase n=1 Tax=Pedobacter sp. MC2016-14 TaxID=2897327 RepID=UPI001E52CD47|nr:NUDIX domain-containing protein [Pedobacter sp. MC2016-14]MCD0489464.1 NUDIX domain-containing protein [Pedobacter sp. MC2016-14]
MAQKYIIYLNDSSLLLTDSLAGQTSEIQQLDVQDFDFLTFYKNLNGKAGKDYVLIAEDPKSILQKIKKQTFRIKAAGGLVQNSSGKFLFIFRNKRWDLPKGKVEKKEKMKEAALREVEEECGVKIKTNDEKICRTYHVYPLDNKIVLKKTNWYSMTVKGSPKLVPQLEEGITKAVWLGKEELKPVLEDTFPLILEVLKAGGLI